MTSVFALALAAALSQAPASAPAAPEPPATPPPDAPAAAPETPTGTPATPAQPRPTTAQPLAPPFVHSVGAVPQPSREMEGQSPPPYVRGARQWVVEPGTSWRIFADKVLPGDEILFTAWFHIPQDFTGLQGTAERPIFIRSRDAKPAAIACEEFGLRFQRCKHIVVENIMFLNPAGCAVMIDGSPVEGAPSDSALATPAPAGWASSITLRHCTVAGVRGDATQDAIRVRNSQGVTIDSVRIEGWSDAAVEIESSRRVLVRGLMTVPATNATQQRGVAVLGASGDVSITASSFNHPIGIGVQVGTPGLPDAHGVPPVPPVERMRIDRCMFDRCRTAFLLANAIDLTISRVTLVDVSDALYAVAADAGVLRDVTIEHALATWPPGGLAKFSPHPSHIPPTAIMLGTNLWFSEELPTAFVEIGQPFGYQAAPQINTIDPNLDLDTMRPRSADAVRYGVFSLAVSPGTTVPDAGAQEAPPVHRAPPAPPSRAR